MSSEESLGEEKVEDGSGPAPRRIIKLHWERSKLAKIKKVLDEKSKSTMNSLKLLRSDRACK